MKHDETSLIGSCEIFDHEEIVVKNIPRFSRIQCAMQNDNNGRWYSSPNFDIMV